MTGNGQSHAVFSSRNGPLQDLHEQVLRADATSLEEFRCGVADAGVEPASACVLARGPESCYNNHSLGWHIGPEALKRSTRIEARDDGRSRRLRHALAGRSSRRRPRGGSTHLGTLFRQAGCPGQGKAAASTSLHGRGRRGRCRPERVQQLLCRSGPGSVSPACRSRGSGAS